MRHAKRVDGNHGEIRDGLRKLGYLVRDTSKMGQGFPDLLVKVGCKLPVLLEIKDQKKPKSGQKLTGSEVEFFEDFGAISYVVTTLDEAISAVGNSKFRQAGWV